MVLASAMSSCREQMDIRRFFARSNEVSREVLDESEPVVFASYALIGAILLLGGLGYFLDKWLGTGPWLLVTGLAAGVLFGLYGVVTSTRRQ
jgi:ATP synthase protein I